MPLQVEVKLGNEDDFKSFLDPKKVSGHDINTLITYWKRALRMKDRAGGGAAHLLLIRRANMYSGQVFIIPFSFLPNITRLPLPPRYLIGWVGCKIPPATYLVFGSMIQSSTENGVGHKDVLETKLNEKTPKKRGRPKKNCV